MTLAFYFAYRFLIGFLKVFIAICLLIYLIDFFENLGRLNVKEDATTMALFLSLLRAPSFISQAMPIIIVLSSIAFCVSLARSSEFVISRAAGRSALTSMLSPMLVAVAIGTIFVFYFDPLSGRLDRLYEVKISEANDLSQQSSSVSKNGYWLRQNSEIGHEIIFAETIHNDGKALREITLLRYGLSGSLESRVYAPLGFINGQEIILVDASIWNLAQLNEDPRNAKSQVQYYRISTKITAKQILDGYVRPNEINPVNMPREIQNIESAGFNTLSYKAQQMAQIARPFLFVAMFLIGAVFTLKNARMGNLGASVLAALVFGFILHSLQNFAMTLGSSGEIPLVIAVWAPTISALFLSIALFLHLEDG